jgi:hypothetical protein
MLINIPFIYEAAIKTVTGSTTMIAVLDHLDVDIKEHKMSDLTLVLKNGPFRSFGTGDDLLEELGFPIAETQHYTPSTKSAVIENMSHIIVPFSNKSFLKPIANYFVHNVPDMDTDDRMRAVHKAFEGGDLLKKEGNIYSEWLTDSREETISSIKTNAESIAFIDDFVYKKRSEPIYVVSIVDAKKYKGTVRAQNSTGQCIMMCKALTGMVEKLKNRPSNAICTYVFNANQYAEACEMANNLAKQINLPIDEPIALAAVSQTVVYEPSAIKFPPNCGEAL